VKYASQNEALLDTLESPFHSGEQAIQSRLGVREQMERFGSKVIRDHMPDQHRAFYSQLPFLILGHCDKAGWPWASIVTAPSGFISSPDETLLSIAARPITGDPLIESLSPGLAIGVLGIEPHTRRRNRLSTVVAGHNANADRGVFQLKVKQSFGNCPQYIQSRQCESVALDPNRDTSMTPFTELSDEAVALIRASDTFYVASSTGMNGNKESASHGTDASHRGGKPGFVSVDSAGVLTIPDYLGNNHFNTLGNFQLYAKAGLLFIDDETRDVLMLTGSVQILWDHDMQPHFDGAQRFWRFQLDHGVWLKNSLPLKTTLNDYSPNTLLTGDWKNAQNTMEANRQKTQWQACRLTRKTKESSSISSFFFAPEAGVTPTFQAGQFITLQVMLDDKPVVRTYTVSNAPGSNEYRISVKREKSGLVSRYLHDALEVGQRVRLKAPLGQFTFDTAGTRYAVMLTAGIGITPIVSMLQDILNDGIKRRHIRRVLVIATVRSDKERAFAKELTEIEHRSGGRIRVLWAMTSPETNLVAGVDYQHLGRVSAALLQSMLPLDDYDFYLCGPDGFMQSTYDMLQQLGVADRKVMAESFGPSSLKRLIEADQALSPDTETAAQALVIIRNAKGEVQTEQQWTKNEGSLLEFAEAHGIHPQFGCRSGACGSCAATLNKGNIVYQQETSARLSEGSILLCCAKPGVESGSNIPTIDIQLSN
jgi:ferredoxin-NADP reductase/predicted pyridoxine 5'-phosphate oxidase superfamily flavin-nucleotide-binding protein